MRPVILSERPRPWSPSEKVLSAGAVVFRDGKALILRRADEIIWCLPKGKVEPGETEGEAAVREVREETGLDCDLLETVHEVAYQYYWPPDDRNFDKRVVYFLAESKAGELDLEDSFDEGRWCFLKKALELLHYENDREVVRKAFDAAHGLLQ